MTRIVPIENPGEDTTILLNAVKKKMGSIPNFLRTMACSTAVLKSYLSYSQSLSVGSLPVRLREQIALLISEENKCNYCIAAHRMLGKGAGLTEQEVGDARVGISSNHKEQSALEFAKLVVRNHGHLTDAEVEKVRQSGYSDGEISEIIANVVLNIFTNYFNIIAETELDFPTAPSLN